MMKSKAKPTVLIRNVVVVEVPYSPGRNAWVASN